MNKKSTPQKTPKLLQEQPQSTSEYRVFPSTVANATKQHMNHHNKLNLQPKKDEQMKRRNCGKTMEATPISQWKPLAMCV